MEKQTFLKKLRTGGVVFFTFIVLLICGTAFTLFMIEHSKLVEHLNRDETLISLWRHQVSENMKTICKDKSCIDLVNPDPDKYNKH